MFEYILVSIIVLNVSELVHRLALTFHLHRKNAPTTTIKPDSSPSSLFELFADNCVLYDTQKRPHCLVAIAALLCIWFATDSTELRHRLTSWTDNASLMVAFLVCRTIGMTDATHLDTLRFLRTSNGLDYGSGMALSYFYGYLRLMLPNYGDHMSKNICERIEDYESRQHVRVPVKKLFVLAPDSMYTPNRLSDGGGSTCSGSLEPLVLNRAGCINRTYHNSVYRIGSSDAGGGASDWWYVVAEGATPLITFQEALRCSDPDAGRVLRRFRDEITASFVRHLRRLLYEDPACRDLCEVVTFRDRDEAGRLVDYGQVLRRAIEESLRRDAKM